MRKRTIQIKCLRNSNKPIYVEIIIDYPFHYSPKWKYTTKSDPDVDHWINLSPSRRIGNRRRSNEFDRNRTNNWYVRRLSALIRRKMTRNITRADARCRPLVAAAVDGREREITPCTVNLWLRDSTGSVLVNHIQSDSLKRSTYYYQGWPIPIAYSWNLS